MALSVALAAARSELLRELVVLRVEPAPNSSHLMVIVGPAGPGPASVTAVEVSEALGHVAGYLRSEVAAAVHRKRAPELSFRFLPAQEADA